MAEQRKRSKRAALMLMMPAGTLLMTGCAPHVQDVVVYSSAQECQQQNPASTQECQADFEQAAALHPDVAPKYATREECEADFGAESCEPAREQHANGSFYMPLMMGYMAGRMLGGGAFMGQPAPGVGGAIPPLQDSDNAAGRGSVATQPLYKSRDDQRTFRTAGNFPVAAGTGLAQVRPADVRPGVGRLTRSGGFGGTAARMSLGSGS
jgi:uncharacterized protein YgiB involved in biofilm formation